MAVVGGGHLVNFDVVTVRLELAIAASSEVAMADPVDAAQLRNVLPVTENDELAYEAEAASRSMAPPQLAVLFVNVDDRIATLLLLTRLRYTTLMEPPFLHTFTWYRQPRTHIGLASRIKHNSRHFHGAATYPKAEPKLKLESVTNTLVVAVAGSIDEAKFTEPPLQYDGEAFAQFEPVAVQPLKIEPSIWSCTLP
jgi:hypothetical protein